jgi:hypothetical protein
VTAAVLIAAAAAVDEEVGDERRLPESLSLFCVATEDGTARTAAVLSVLPRLTRGSLIRDKGERVAAIMIEAGMGRENTVVEHL